MIYNSNQDDIDKRHIWTVAGRWFVEAGAQTLEVRSAANGSRSMTSDGNVAAMHADAQMPPHVMVIWPDGNAHSCSRTCCRRHSIRRRSSRPSR